MVRRGEIKIELNLYPDIALYIDNGYLTLYSFFKYADEDLMLKTWILKPFTEANKGNSFLIVFNL